MTIALILLVGSLFIAILLCRHFLVIITVRGQSMEPTLTEGDRVVVIRHWPRRWLRKNQIVIVQNGTTLPTEEEQGRTGEPAFGQELLIKRLIALPLETVVISRTDLDATTLAMMSDAVRSRYDGENLIWQIPAAHGFIKGDGAVSMDSVLQGPIPLAAIKGIVVVKLPHRSPSNIEQELRAKPLSSPSLPFGVGHEQEANARIMPPGFFPGKSMNGASTQSPVHGQSLPTDNIPWEPAKLPSAYGADQQHWVGDLSQKGQTRSNLAGFNESQMMTEPSLHTGRGFTSNREGVQPIAVVRYGKTIIAIIKVVWQAYPLACLGSILITIIQGLLPLANAWVTKVLFDWLAQQLAGNTITGGGQLIGLLAAQAVTTTAMVTLPSVSHYLNSELSRRLTVTIQTTIYRKLNDFAGIAYFENPQVYDTIRLAQEGAEHSSNQTLQILMQFLQNAVTLVTFVGVLFSFNLTLAGLVLLSALPQLLAQLKLGQQRYGLAFEISTDERRKIYYNFLLAGVEAAKEMRLFGLGEYFLNKLLTLYKRVNQAERALEQRALRWELWLSLFSSAVAAATFIFIVMAAFGGRLTLGDITLYISAVAAVQGALNGAIFSVAGLNESVLFHSYYQDLLALSPPLPVKIPTQPAPPLASGLELRHVSFRYHENQPWILQDVNLTIPAGGCLALVGLNGAGKTTLVKLLTRLYDPTEGQILWDGIDIREFHPDELRQRIGAIFQDFMRYDLTVRENIGLGNLEHIDDSEWVQQAARKANIHEDILRLPHGYETELSRMFAEEGVGLDLSGGQWQKIATARMFARTADLLILDEPTAALDAQSEYDVYSHFAELMADRTSVLISHRFSTVRMADTIAVLEGGRITEYGSHAELMRLNGAYARLYNMQAESYLPATVYAAA